jgi:hypothetical protein
LPPELIVSPRPGRSSPGWRRRSPSRCSAPSRPVRGRDSGPGHSAAQDPDPPLEPGPKSEACRNQRCRSCSRRCGELLPSPGRTTRLMPASRANRSFFGEDTPRSPASS